MRFNKLLLVLILVFLCFNVFAIEVAPLNPKFVDYMRYKSINKEIGKYKDVTGYIPSPILPVSSWIKSNAKGVGFPQAYDLRDENRVSPIRNQAPWGTCWAFGAMASVESNVRTQNPFLDVDYSEFNMVRESSRYGRTLGTGGDYLDAMNYYTRLAGPINENDDPYITDMSKIDWTVVLPPLNNQPAPVALVEGVSFMPVSSFERIPSMLDLDGNIELDILNAIKDSIMSDGAIGFAFYYNDAYITDDDRNFYCPDKYEPNHAISIVGWDDNYSKSNFKISPPADGAFLARNSWGSDWGDNGYFWMSYYDKTAGYYSSFNTVSLDTKKYDKMYLNNNGGWLQNANGQIARSHFVIKEDTILKAVTTPVYIGGLMYNIHIYVNGMDIGSKVGNWNYSGYAVVPIDSNVFLAKNDELDVVVDYDYNNESAEKYKVPIEIDIADFYTSGTYKPRQSYIFENDLWTDLSDSRMNTCIRVLTNSIEVIPVTNITLNKHIAFMVKGESLNLISNITPSNASSKKIRWSSSNTKVAMVDDNGIVTSVGSGTANIIAMAIDGSKTASCQIIVKNSVAVKSVSISPKYVFIKSGESKQLSLYVSPGNATNKSVTWISLNNQICKVSSTGLVTGIRSGNAVIKVITADGNKTATININVKGQRNISKIIR